jgi:hypothetical protein
MGKSVLIWVLIGSLSLAIIGLGMRVRSNEAADAAVSYFVRQKAKDIAASVTEIYIKKLAQGSVTLPNVCTVSSVMGGRATVELLEISPDTVLIRTVGTFNAYSDSVKAYCSPEKAPPPVVRGAFTAFGPINDAISDMYIDGRNWKADLSGIVPGKGMYAVSTGAATFINTQQGYLGGTLQPPNSPADITPAFPNDPRVVETNSSWPNGWPTTPDMAMGGPSRGFPEGTLKSWAINEVFPGSQYVTDAKDLKYPLRGVTYIEVPDGTVVSGKGKKGKKGEASVGPIQLGPSPEGILVFHSPSTNAFWDNISVTNGQPFKGLMIMDGVFHIHMDILGALVLLDPNTVVGKTCNGNKDHWIRFSSEQISLSFGGSASFKVLSWWE